MSSSWKKNELGVVDTIYEEEFDEQEQQHSSNSASSSPPSLSPNSISSSPPPPLHSKVHSWSLATGRKPDVLIYVMGTCFHLHKDPLTSRSTYLKRQLTELSAITLPLNITAETFTLIAEFCYGTHVVLSPFNVAALRTAAELMGMTEINGRHDENLRQITETYFCRVIAVDRVLVMIVFRSCLRLLPESETMAFLVSRCIEALRLTADGDDLDGCFEDVITLDVEEFQIVAESMRCRFSSHDMLYIIVDLYIKEHNEKITEEQKNEICKFIDCDKLSSQFLIHAVQNPRLPLRFIVRAMLIEQLNTRRAFITATAPSAAASTDLRTRSHSHSHSHSHSASNGSITLGSILRREAASREAASIKSEMDATNSRIQSLENELAGMKRLLIKSEKEKIAMEKKLIVMQKPKKNLVESDEKESKEERSVIGSGRSASFHYGFKEIGNKIGRGEKGSSSFAGIRVRFGEEKVGAGSLISSNESTPRSGKKVINGGMGLIRRLKNTLWVSKSSSSPSPKLSRKEDYDDDDDDDGSIGSREDGKENIVIITTKNDDASIHKRSRSVE